MFILVRDEDPPTVAAAIEAFTDEAGLERVEVEVTPDNPFAMLGALTLPRVVVSASDDQVCIAGLELLDIAEPEEWASSLSASCESEVVAIVPTDGGLHVYVYDGGEADEDFAVPLDPSGVTKAPRLVDLAESEAGEQALAAGIQARDVEGLIAGVLAALGVQPPGEDAVILTFRDPLEGQQPGLNVSSAGDLEGAVARPVAAGGSGFEISLVGFAEIEGVRLALSGDGLELVGIGVIEIVMRKRGAAEVEVRKIVPDVDEGSFVIDLPDAYLEETQAPGLDAGGDLFGALQKMMSAGESMRLNRLSVSFNAVGMAAGEGTITLTATPIGDGEIPAGSGEVHVVIAR